GVALERRHGEAAAAVGVADEVVTLVDESAEDVIGIRRGEGTALGGVLRHDRVQQGDGAFVDVVDASAVGTAGELGRAGYYLVESDRIVDELDRVALPGHEGAAEGVACETTTAVGIAALGAVVGERAVENGEGALGAGRL